MGPAYLDLVGGDAHFVVFGDSESGKTTFLNTLATGLCNRYGPDEARFVIIDYRRGLLDSVPARTWRLMRVPQPAVNDAAGLARGDPDPAAPWCRCR